MSESTKNIYQKLLNVKKTITYLKKDNAGMQYKYVSSSQVLSALRESMNNEGLLLIPEINEAHQTNYQNKKDSTVYFTELKMKFTWINVENLNEKVECPWYGQGVDIGGEKGVGKALTYAEKYFLLKFFNIPTDKDDPDSFQQKIDNGKEMNQEQIHKNSLINEFTGLMGKVKFAKKDEKLKLQVITFYENIQNASIDTITNTINNLKKYYKNQEVNNEYCNINKM